MKIFIMLIMMIPGFAFGGNTYNCKITSQADRGASTVSVMVLASQASRRCLLVQNNGASTIYIKFNAAHTGTENMSLASGASWAPIVIPINSLWIRSSAGVCNTTILEGQ